MEHSVGRRAETPSGWRARRGFRKAEANEEQLASMCRGISIFGHAWALLGGLGTLCRLTYISSRIQGSL